MEICANRKTGAVPGRIGPLMRGGATEEVPAYSITRDHRKGGGPISSNGVVMPWCIVI